MNEQFIDKLESLSETDKNTCVMCNCTLTDENKSLYNITTIIDDNKILMTHVCAFCCAVWVKMKEAYDLGLLLSEDQARKIIAEDGWSIETLKAKEEMEINCNKIN